MRTRQSGFTLIELMISLALGLLLAFAATQILLSNQRVFAFQEAASTLYEDSYITMRYLNEDIIQSGFGTRTDGADVPIIRAGVVPSAWVSTDPPPPSVTGADDTPPALDGESDQLVITYLGRDQGTGIVNCEGETAPNDIVINRYYIDDEGTLRCQGLLSDEASCSDCGIEILPNVVRFRVLYGVDETEDDTVNVNRYLTSDDLAADDVIVAVRYAFMARSVEQNLQRDDNPSTFYVLDDQLELTPGGSLFRVFTSTVQLRNYRWESI